MSQIEQNTRGSQWRKWDMQVQTILDDAYVSIDSYWDNLKRDVPDKCQALIDKIGSEDLIKQYDSKQYFFTDSTTDAKVKARNYAKLFLNYLDIFVEDAGVICLTDHNYEHEYLLDAFILESKDTKIKVIAGVEINVQGVHMIILLDKKPYGKQTYSEGIKALLAKLEIDNKKTGTALTVSNKSYTDVLKVVEDVGGLAIYPHCNSSNGLFQERGKTDRTHLADHFNAQKVNILQSRHKTSADVTTGYIASNNNLKSDHVFTLGSDSRCLKDVFAPDDAGNFCWIKADPTFEGLKQISFEPDRIYIGAEPTIFSAVQARPTKFIHSLSIKKVVTYDGSQGIWFDDAIFPINPELITIIGNKGSGKSAVADVLGLIGNTPNHEDFSFLAPKKFKKGNLATKFEAELTWASGQKETKNLGDEVDANQPETIKYLPQNYFEKLCNDLNDKTFSAELEQVVFSHLSEEKKFGQKTFSDLIGYKSQNITNELEALKGEITEINQKLIKLEEKSHPNHKEKAENLKKQKELEIKAHEETLPKEVKDPSKESGAVEQQKKDIEAITKLNDDIELLAAEKQTREDERSGIVKELEDLKNFKQALQLKEKDIAAFKQVNQTIAEKYFGSWDKLITLKVEYKPIDTEITEKTKKLNEYNNLLISSDALELIQDTKQRAALAKKSIQVRIETKATARDELKKKLDEPTRKYQAYLEAKAKWDAKKKELVGDERTSGSLKFYEAYLQYLEKSLTAAIEQARQDRLEKTIEILKKKKEVVEIYQTVKDSIDAIIQSNQHLLQEYKIILNAGFVFSESFEKQFFSFVNQQVKGSFRGRDEGEKLLRATLAEINPNDEQSIRSFLSRLIELLEKDQRSEVKEDEQRKYISDQISGDQQNFFNYLFSLDYLDANYQLQLDAKNIDTLSPGEKGALLLVFYLMLDKNDIPLVIDQPEDNLDNKSVSRILVPFIKQAKKRRQIIMVTHNPNLAVVADAEQVICVNIDKTDNNRFSSSSGGIENPEINKAIVDILEGTRPAFDKRRLKYKQDESE